MPIEDNDHFWRKIFLLFGVGYLLFIIYGSLVPFEFNSIGLKSGWHQFLKIDFLDISVESRTDWAANVLLFIPLAFIWAQILVSVKNLYLRLGGSFILLMFLALISTCIEFIQLFIPVRTTSPNDILAETIGGGIGLFLWFCWGGQFIDWLRQWKGQQTYRSMSSKSLWGYLFIFVLYNLLPLDLSISPIEIYRKWKSGHIVFAPFSFLFHFDAKTGYEIVTDVLLWLPVAFLWTLAEKGAWKKAIVNTVLISSFLELLQLFIGTRITDINDILFSLVGGCIGAWLALLFVEKNNTQIQEQKQAPRSIAWHWFILFFAWAGIIALLFWYPYNVSLERDFIYKQLARFNQLPFSAYYFGSEFKAITAIFKRVLFFIPLGVIAYLSVHKSQKISLLTKTFSFLLCALVAAIVEIGRWLIPLKSPDTSDFFLEIIGSWIGFKLVIYVLGKNKYNDHAH